MIGSYPRIVVNIAALMSTLHILAVSGFAKFAESAVHAGELTPILTAIGFPAVAVGLARMEHQGSGETFGRMALAAFLLVPLQLGCLEASAWALVAGVLTGALALSVRMSLGRRGAVRLVRQGLQLGALSALAANVCAAMGLGCVEFGARAERSRLLPAALVALTVIYGWYGFRRTTLREIGVALLVAAGLAAGWLLRPAATGKGPPDFILVAVMDILIVAMPGVIRHHGWLRKSGALVLSILWGVGLFLLAAIPYANTEAPLGKDSFGNNPLHALPESVGIVFPLIAWAAVASYMHDVRGVNRIPEPRWVSAGFLAGAIGMLCMILATQIGGGGFAQLMVLPLCYFVWCFATTLRTGTRWGIAHWLASTVWIPLVAIGVRYAYVFYGRLPDKAPTDSCFVVTAAMGGHPALTGPRHHVWHAGEMRPANRQLETFWRFEVAWAARHPASHGIFRRFYNVWGRRAARLLRGRWACDAAFVVLLPAEGIARMCLYLAAKSFEPAREDT